MSRFRDQPEQLPSDPPALPGHDLPESGKPGHDLPEGGKPSNELPSGGAKPSHELPSTGKPGHDLPERKPGHVSGGYVHPLGAATLAMIDQAKAEKRNQVDTAKAAIKESAYSGNQNTMDALDAMLIELEEKAAASEQEANIYRQQADQLRREMNMIRYVA